MSDSKLADVVLTDFGGDCIHRYTLIKEYAPGLIVGALICFLLILSALAYRVFTWASVIFIAIAIMIVAVIFSPFFVTLCSWCSFARGRVSHQYEEL